MHSNSERARTFARVAVERVLSVANDEDDFKRREAAQDAVMVLLRDGEGAGDAVTRCDGGSDSVELRELLLDELSRADGCELVRSADAVPSRLAAGDSVPNGVSDAV